MSFSGKAYPILVDLVYEHSHIRLGADKQMLLANRLQPTTRTNVPLQMPKARNWRLSAHLTRVAVLRPMGKGRPSREGRARYMTAMSAHGTKQTSILTLNMSAFGGKADMPDRAR